MADYAADVGQRIRTARERNRPDLSQEAAAHEIGVSVKQYGRWERGESQPRADKWTALADALQVTVEDLRGTPPIAPEHELRNQLDRLEANQAEILGGIDAIASALLSSRDADRDATLAEWQARRQRRSEGEDPGSASQGEG